MLKKLIIVLLPVLIISFIAGISYGYGDRKAKTKKAKTYSGILIDTKCYAMNNDNITNDHGEMKGCAAMCSKMGIPV